MSDRIPSPYSGSDCGKCVTCVSKAISEILRKSELTLNEGGAVMMELLAREATAQKVNERVFVKGLAMVLAQCMTNAQGELASDVEIINLVNGPERPQ